MLIDISVYTVTNGQRNSTDHAVNNIDDALKVVRKALIQGKNINIVNHGTDNKTK